MHISTLESRKQKTQEMKENSENSTRSNCWKRAEPMNQQGTRTEKHRGWSHCQSSNLSRQDLGWGRQAEMPQVCAGELLFHHKQGAAPVDHRVVTSKALTDFYVESKAETRLTNNAYKTWRWQQPFHFGHWKHSSCFIMTLREKGMGRNHGTNVVLSSPTVLLDCMGRTLITILWHFLPTYRLD